jgi:Ser-tRNA(Ala) deacylase AlaX
VATALLFRENPYLRRCETTVTAADERGIRLGATVFYRRVAGSRAIPAPSASPAARWRSPTR